MALPTSGSLSIKAAAGSNRSVACEVDGNTSGNKSLLSLGNTAFGSSAQPHSILDFYGYEQEAYEISTDKLSLSIDCIGGFDYTGVDTNGYDFNIFCVTNTCFSASKYSSTCLEVSAGYNSSGVIQSGRVCLCHICDSSITTSVYVNQQPINIQPVNIH